MTPKKHHYALLYWKLHLFIESIEEDFFNVNKIYFSYKMKKAETVSMKSWWSVETKATFL